MIDSNGDKCMTESIEEVVVKLIMNDRINKIFLLSKSKDEFLDRLDVWFQETNDPYIYLLKGELDKKKINRIKDYLWIKLRNDKRLKKVRKKNFVNDVTYSFINEPSEIRKFNDLEEWMKAFFLIGDFLSKKSHFNIYISYIDSLIPAIFSALGFIHSTYSEMETEDFITLFSDFKNEDEICFKPSNNKNTWEIRTFKNVDKKKKMLLIENKKLLLTNHIPDKDIPLKIRVKGNVKKVSGSSPELKMNDKTNPILGTLYTRKVETIIKVMNSCLINIFGRAISEKYMGIINSLLLKLPNQDEFKINDILYSQYNGTNFRNVELIKSYLDIKESGRLNIFIDENNATNFWEIKGNKNIIFADRKKIDKVYHDDLFDQIRRSKSEETNLIKELENYFREYGVKFPRGVEIIAW